MVLEGPPGSRPKPIPHCPKCFPPPPDTQTAAVQGFRFLDLPREIRDKIYELCIPPVPLECVPPAPQIATGADYPLSETHWVFETHWVDFRLNLAATSSQVRRELHRALERHDWEILDSFHIEKLAKQVFEKHHTNPRRITLTARGLWGYHLDMWAVNHMDSPMPDLDTISRDQIKEMLEYFRDTFGQSARDVRRITFEISTCRLLTRYLERTLEILLEDTFTHAASFRVRRAGTCECGSFSREGACLNVHDRLGWTCWDCCSIRCERCDEQGAEAFCDAHLADKISLYEELEQDDRRVERHVVAFLRGLREERAVRGEEPEPEPPDLSVPGEWVD